VTLGGSFRSSTTITLEGQTTWADPPWLRPNPTIRTAKVDFEFPMTFVAGISYRPTPKWNLEFDADYTDWSSIGTLTFRQSDRVPGYSPTNQTYVLNWEPSWMYEFGVTRYFGDTWRISAGYVFNQNSVPDAHFTPLVPDMDRHFFSVGAGFKWKAFNLDLAYQYGYGPSRKVMNSIPPLSGQIAGQSADGTYKFSSHAISLSAGVHY
jgi:long-chain fatty acid transport protein